MDFDEITLGELAEIEAYADASITEITEATPASTKLKIGMAWVLKRRTDPKFTLEQAKALTMSELMEFLDLEQPKK